MKKRKRANYTEEFKKDAGDLVMKQGYGNSDADKRLGILIFNILRWVRKHKKCLANSVTQRNPLNSLTQKVLSNLILYLKNLKLQRVRILLNLRGCHTVEVQDYVCVPSDLPFGKLASCRIRDKLLKITKVKPGML